MRPIPRPAPITAPPDHGATGREAGTDHRHTLRILNNRRSGLEETHDFHRIAPIRSR